MTDPSGAEYTNPYGDLQEPRPQHSTFAYHGGGERRADEESRGLIKTPGAKPESQSDLAMAVVDILSCCDGSMNPNQAKLLRAMENRYQESGNLINREEDQPEQFYDEETTIKKKFSPLKWFARSEDKREKYQTRSSSFITELPVREEPTKPEKSQAWKYACVVVAVGMVLIFAIVVWVTRLSGSLFDTSNLGPNRKPIPRFTSDCTVVGKQDNPSPLSQCACGDSIHTMSDQAKEKYDTLLYAFGAEYLHTDETRSSCSSRNQALVWLAEDPGSTLSEVLIQRHSLVLFFIKMHGISWTLDEHQKWLTSGHECTWFGVVCNADKEVTAIELWNLGLAGQIPREIMSLTNLERLSLPENQIKGHLPVDAFVMMSKLTDLTLFMNSISGPIDHKIFHSLTRLKTINLDSNAFTGPIPSQVGKLTELVELKLARNNLKGTLPTELGKLTLLKKIEMEENNLYGPIPTQLGELSRLESLDLSWNNLQGPIPWEFQAFRNLKDLFLKSNDLGGTLPEIISVMGELQNLVLSLNAFSGPLPLEMNLMSSLTTLHLDENKFDGTVPAELGSCAYLRDVRLNNNHFSGTVPSELGRLAWLISFSLEGNSFSGTVPSEVCDLRGTVGTLETFTATCAALVESEADREKGLVFGKAHELLCRVPDCCTSCSAKR